MSGTFLFADLAGFTALTEAHGDQQAADLATEFRAWVRELLPRHRADDIKQIGDALMLRAAEAADGVRLGIEIVCDLGQQDRFPSVRVGMHSGEALEREGDWFGATVNLAARVSALAEGGEVLLTAATRDAAGDPAGIAFEDRGRRTLRHVREPVSLYAATPEGERTTERLPIDPVCHMGVDPRHSAGELVFEGTRFHFCSLECASAFAREPEIYATRSARAPER